MTPGASDSRLFDCPSSPNCVSSEASDPGHRVAPFELTMPVVEAWSAIRECVAALPRTTIVMERGHSLHAECRSVLLGFVDDLEVHVGPGQSRMSVRSASRVGYSDLGVNRRRVERLRASLRARGLVR